MNRLAKLPHYWTRVELDGQTLEGDFIFGGVTNSTSVAGLVKLDQNLVSLDDGLFEVSLVRFPENLADMNKLMSEVAAHRYDGEMFSMRRSERVRFIFPEAVPFTRDGEPGGSFLQYPGALEVGVEFFSLSKSFNVTGARIGFLVGREDVVSAFAKLRGQIDFGMFFPIQKAAIACLNGPRDEVEAQRLKYQERRDALCDGLEGLGWERPNAHGSMFVWAKLPGGRTDSMAFCEELMEKAGVVVTPGASFGPSGEGHVRMALVLPPDQIALAVEAIREAGLY